MSDLLKMDVLWTWCKILVDAFTSVKQSLLEAPVLALPDASVVYDTSIFAIGVALMQRDEDGIDRVISYQASI